MLDRNKFKNFEQAGFSIHCPGTGLDKIHFYTYIFTIILLIDADCLDTPISDPHHFRIVEKTTDGKSFVS